MTSSRTNATSVNEINMCVRASDYKDSLFMVVYITEIMSEKLNKIGWQVISSP